MNLLMKNYEVEQIACMMKPENLEKGINAFSKMFGTIPYPTWTIVENKELICLNGEVRSDPTCHNKNFRFDNVMVELLTTNQAPSGWSLRLNNQGEKFSHFAFFSQNRDESYEAAVNAGWERTLEGQEEWGGYMNLEHPDNPWFYTEMYFLPVNGGKWGKSPKPENFTMADYLDDLMIREVGVAVRDLDDAVEKICRLYDLEMPEIKNVIDAEAEYKGVKKVTRKRTAKIPFKNYVWEFYEPAEEGGIYKEWIEKQGEGISHFTFAVSDLEKSVKSAETTGLKLDQKGRDIYGDYACLTYPDFPLLYVRLINK